MSVARLLTIRHVAAVLPLAPATIAAMCRDGRLRAVKLARADGRVSQQARWLVYEDSLAALLGEGAHVRRQSADLERRAALAAARQGFAPRPELRDRGPDSTEVL